MGAGVVSWTTPEQLKTDLLRKWERGDIARAIILGMMQELSAEGGPEETPQSLAESGPGETRELPGESGPGETRQLPGVLFPLEMRLKRPRPREVAERFGDVMEWIDRLREGSRQTRGYGYELRWERVNNRVHGANELPVAAVFPTEEDALRLIRRQGEATRLKVLAASIAGRYPALGEWVARRPLAVLEHGEKWERLLAVVEWFVAHPRSGLYLRQLDIAGVDTKFIEAHRGILTELLDRVLPPDAIDASATGTSQFAARYGLRQEAPMIRFRLLDPALAIQGLSDLAVLPEEFARLDLSVRRVFITENRTNGLAFPSCPESLVIFGLGYGIDRLSDIPWLKETEIWYWGDIDTHGFGILNRLRDALPHARSFLMDRETLMAHRDLWGEEPAGKRYDGEPTRLTADEYALFDDLRLDRLGERVRLEQERVSWGWWQKGLGRITTSPL